MKQETFFEKFDRLTDVPDAVAGMRSLVLHLAVHGNLVSQSPDDEPATELLERSRTQMTMRMATRQAKQEKPAEPVSDDKSRFAIPTGWAWCRLVDAGQFINGLAFKPSHWGNVGRPIIRIQNLSGRSSDYNRTTGKFDSSVLVQDGDILVSWSATLDAFIWRGEEGVLNQHIFRVIPAPLANKGFLYWLLKWVIRQLADSDHAHGLVMSHINRGPFLAHPIPLPPLAEQARIVAKVDELMALCDQLEAQQQDRETRHAALSRASLARFADAPTPANLQFLFHPSYAIAPADLRKSILTLAAQGRLVPQETGDETAEALLERVAALREQFSRGRRVNAAKRIREIDNSKCVHDLPHSWAWCRLGDLVLEFRYGTSRKCTRGSNGVPVLRIPNIQNGWIDSGDMKFTDMPPGEFQELRLQAGDLLLVRSNGSENLVGRSAVASADDERFAYAGYLVRARIPRDEVFAPFLQLALSTPAVRDQIEKPIRTTSGVKNINTTELSNLVIPVAPFAEQRRIVAKVGQLMALMDELETQLATSRRTGAALMEAVVADLTAKA